MGFGCCLDKIKGVYSRERAPFCHILNLLMDKQTVSKSRLNRYSKKKEKIEKYFKVMSLMFLGESCRE